MMRVTCLAAMVVVTLVPQVAAAQADPPGRVGRVARVAGTVSYRLGADPAWRPATVNLPLTTATSLWTEPGAAVDLGVGGTHLAMDASTELDVTRLDDHEMDITQPQGALCLHPSVVARGDTYMVQTPRGTVQITAAGRYEVVAGDTGHPTAITVLDGSAVATGPTFNLSVGANQTAFIDGDGGAATPFRTALGPATRDAFLLACLAREHPAAANRPAAASSMTGAEALDEYGSWTPNPQYGPIWYPRDDPGYVPYRAGHWTDVAPWGWTWVDDAPWGFAPSHYGRWVEVNDRWGWVASAPGTVGYDRPVYAPAVVGFVAGAAFGTLVADRPVGWVPLGPREPYFPPYRVSNSYVRRLNVTNVRNVTSAVQTYNTTVVNAGAMPPARGAFLNARAATVAPGGAIAAGQSIGPVGRPIPPDALQQATFARPPPGGGAPAVATPSPGPAVAGAPAGGRPALRRVAGEPGQPGAGTAPGVPAGRPGEPVFGQSGPGPSAPALRAPGTGRPAGPNNILPPGAPDTRPAAGLGAPLAGIPAGRAPGAERSPPSPGGEFHPSAIPGPRGPENRPPPGADGRPGLPPDPTGESRSARPGRPGEPNRASELDRPSGLARPNEAGRIGTVRAPEPPHAEAPARIVAPPLPAVSAPRREFQPRPGPPPFAPQPRPVFQAPQPRPQPAPPPQQFRPAPRPPQAAPPHPAPPPPAARPGPPPGGRPGPHRPGEPG